MILDDLFHNGQPDSASAFHGVAGRVRPVKPLKYIAEVFCRDSLAVVLDFYPDGIHLIQQANINHAFLFVHIFDAVANDIVDDFFELLRICDNPSVGLHQIGIIQLDIFRFQIQPDVLYAVCEKFCNVYPVEIVRNTIIINTGIIGQLIDQPIHVVRFCVNRAQIFVPTLRCVRHTVDNSFHIALDRRDRSF